MPPVATTLTKRADFLKARYEGTTLRRGAFVLQQRQRDPDDPVIGPRIGYTASKKVGNAVARNRAKRRLREAVRLLPEGALPVDGDTVLIARHNTGRYPFDRLQRDLLGTLTQLARERDRTRQRRA